MRRCRFNRGAGFGDMRVPTIALMSNRRSEGLRGERVESSRQFRDGRFHNLAPVAPGIKGNPLPILGEYMFHGGQRVPPAPLPTFDPREAWSHPPDSGLRVTWLGHSTVLLEVDGLRILTDPVFGQRASPVSFMGPRRFHPAPAPIAALPPLDVVLLSHDHYDHLCHESIVEIAARDVPFVTALGVGARLEARGVSAARIHELDWNEQVELPGVRFTATAAQHFSGRSMSDRNSTLWASWVIETEQRRIFFSGDTGLFPELRAIGEQHGPFDLVMLEIGAFHPAWSDIHLGPKNAQVAHEMLRGKLLLPVHWGTFNLAMHDWNEPAETLYTLAAESGTRLLLPRLGLPSEPSHEEHAAPWWREIAGARR
jgi:L-ascorbate metabolism protein UlaG (beta-lactamase superfamily)